MEVLSWKMGNTFQNLSAFIHMKQALNNKSRRTSTIWRHVEGQ